MMDWLYCFENYKRFYRTHALLRMYQRDISFDDLEEIKSNIEIIEEYPEDTPYPSCLILGFNNLQKPIHVVFSVNISEKVVFVITVYEPDACKWENNFRRKK